MTIVLRQLIGTSNSPHQCRRFEIPASVTRVHLRNFKSKSGTRIIELLVPFGFRSSCPRVPHRITNFENRALAPQCAVIDCSRAQGNSSACRLAQSTLPHGRRSSELAPTRSARRLLPLGERVRTSSPSINDLVRESEH